MLDIIKKHLQTKGFKKRLRYWYIPALKVGVSWLYKKAHGYFERRYFTEQYITNKSIEETPKEPLQTNYTPKQDAVLGYAEAVEIMRKYQISHDPQYLGTCVANTIKNAIRFASNVVYGMKFDLSEGDIYIDRETTHLGIDAGMYPDKAIERVAVKGVAIQTAVPTAKTIAELKSITRTKYPDRDLIPYRIKPLKGQKQIAGHRDFDSIWAYITTMYASKKIKPFQASITSYAGWWGTDIPKATGNIYGSHSIVGVSIPFMYDNERAFFVIDSAYSRGTVWRVGRGIRIVTESTWKKLGNSAREITFVDSIEEKFLIKRQEIVLTETAKYGDSGEHVAKIQEALLLLGFNIPSIQNGTATKGYYGDETALAVQNWQLANANKFTKLNSYWNANTLLSLHGKSFGNLSLRVMNDILKNML